MAPKNNIMQRHERHIAVPKAASIVVFVDGDRRLGVNGSGVCQGR
eukprot:CAMPEP_0183710362 /NCGR_PEP_ID=MMETSP0737-20130205/6107_1 /TAXON_ID=385413 /ORGANISM="Thalassiosira miniscula, Strain CCMP1093" /LENGTH=44 /DNA_ID= /DNA_START= /DNA_END= /DNA_ORIENTATION=